MSSIVLLPVLIIIILFITAVPAIIGFSVYRDAKARGMEPMLWTLLVVFAPGFIGLIIYLIMRRDHIKLSCPQCGNEVRQGFVSCPNCGHKLAASCASCGAALNPEWKLCPQCGTEITEVSEFAPPVVVKPNNKGFMIAIIAIMLIPLAVIIFAPLAFVASRTVLSGNYHDNLDETYDFTYKLGFEPVCVTSSDISALTDAHRNWIKQKQSGKEGIYAMTFSKPETGEKKTDELTGKYSVVYDYTIVVVNSKENKAYGVDAFDFDSTEPYIPYSLNVILAETPPDDDEAVRYGNVFVIRTISEYKMKWNYNYEENQHSLENQKENSEKTFTVTLKNGKKNGDVSYTVPLMYDKDCYISFNK